VLVLACQLGTCIAYNIFLSISLTAIVESMMPESDMQRAGYDPYVFFIVCQVLLFSLMVQMREMATLAPLLIFAQFAMVIAVGIIIGNGLVNPSVCDRDGSERILCKVHAGLRPDTYAIYVGIAVFAMEGIPTILAIENSLAEPDRFEEMFDRAQMLLTIVFMLFGTGGYWLYGNNTRSVVTLNVPGFQGVTVKMLMVAVIFCSYPLQFVPIAQVAQSYVQGDAVQRVLVRLWGALPEWVVTANIFGKNQLDFSLRVWGMTKIVAVIFTGVIAAAVPHFGHVLSLMGCCTFSTITFVLPPVMFLMSRQGQHQFQNVIMCCMLMLFGALVTTVGLYGNMTSETVWHHNIEKAPPLVGSAEAKQARAVFKTAAGEIKQDPYIYSAAHGTLSPQLAKRGKATVSPVQAAGASSTDANGWALPTDKGGAHRAEGDKNNDLNAKHKFYRDAEAVAKMEGMVKSTAAWHAIVPPKWKKGRAAAAAKKKLLELKKTRQAKGGQAGSWVKIDSKYIASAVPVAKAAEAASQPWTGHPWQATVAPGAVGSADDDKEARAAAAHGGREVPAHHAGEEPHVAPPAETQVVQPPPPPPPPPPPQQQQQQQQAAPNAERGWVPRPQSRAVSIPEQGKAYMHESPLQKAQHELAVEKYKNALLREKEAEKEMKETEYRGHKTTQGRPQYASRWFCGCASRGSGFGVRVGM
jgi:amino acid permease